MDVIVIQLLSHVQLFVTPLTTTCQVPLPSTISRSLLKLMSIEFDMSLWCYLTISSSAAPFYFCLQLFPASGSFPMSWLFASGGQSIGASVLVLPMNIQSWFPLGLTNFISLQSKGLSRVFSSTIQKYQFFSAQPFLQSSSHIHIWLLEKA